DYSRKKSWRVPTLYEGCECNTSRFISVMLARPSRIFTFGKQGELLLSATWSYSKDLLRTAGG
ncbi:MAG: hypothetical protein ABSF90_17790, partial [Syntrophobacteraceae bacterium]